MGKIHEYAKSGDLQGVKRLIGGKTDPDEVTYFGSTALHSASRYGSVYIVKYLVEKATAGVDKTDNDILTALHYASDNGHVDVVKYLVEEAKAEVDKTDNGGLTALDRATENNHNETQEYLRRFEMAQTSHDEDRETAKCMKTNKKRRTAKRRKQKQLIASPSTSMRLRSRAREGGLLLRSGKLLGKRDHSSSKQHGPKPTTHLQRTKHPRCNARPC